MPEVQDRRWRRTARMFAALALGTVVGTAAAGVSHAALATPTVPIVAAGYAHTCAVRTDGSLWCWGSNYSGEIGDGTNTSQTTPVHVGTATNWAGIDAGGNFTCALRTDGTLWCWGSNLRGQLGDGTTTNRNAPAQVGTATTWASGSAGGYHRCAVRTDRTRGGWGNSRV